MSVTDTLPDRLDAGLRALKLSASASSKEKLLAYLALLAKWNKTYNLTAIRDPDQMLVQHLFDSLAVVPALENDPVILATSKSALTGRQCQSISLVDAGSGAGLPGLVLAITRPEWRIRSVETVKKKLAFQRQVCIELDLANVDLASDRVEHLPSNSADCVISRAFSDIKGFIAVAGHISTRLLAMKGQIPDHELAQVPRGWRVTRILPLAVPELLAQRHLIILDRE